MIKPAVNTKYESQNRAGHFIILILIFSFTGLLPIHGKQNLFNSLKNESIITNNITAHVCLITGNNDSVADFTIYYPVNRHDILSNYATNAITLANISNFANRITQDSCIKIKELQLSGSCSLDGSDSFNQELAKARYSSFLNYLKIHDPQLLNYPVTINLIGENWMLLKEWIEQSQLDEKEAVLAIINNPESENVRLSKLQKLNDGKSYSYLKDHYFSKLRFARLRINYDYQAIPQTVSEKYPENEKTTINESEITAFDMTVISLPSEEEIEFEEIKKPFIALKTNLLYDAVTVLNVEVEVPIKQHWSIAGEWIFPWWLHNKNRADNRPARLEVLCGTLEGRYWFGKREEKRVLTGWYAGIYSGAGLYDLQWKAKGYQGEFFVAAGISAGFAHPVGKHLSMEYGLGIGYLKTHYRHYQAFFGPDNKWHPIRLNNGHYSWFGPTRAKVSLVWLLDYKTKKGGRR